MMHNPIKNCTCDNIIIIENMSPFIILPVGGNNDGSLLISFGYDLEQHVSTEFVDGEIAEFIN